MKKLLIFIIVIFSFPAFAYSQNKSINRPFKFGTKSTMSGIMQSWLGENIDSVINQWGYPNEEKIIANKHLYYWYTYVNAYIPSQTTGHVNSLGYYNSITTGGYTLNGQCTRILEVDPNNIVINWQWQGNNCPFAEWFQYSKWRNK